MTPATLETARLRLRPWREADLEPLFVLNGDAVAMRHFPTLWNRAESDAWARRLAAHVEAHGWGFWAVEERAGAAFIGTVGLMPIGWDAWFTPAVEIGWRILPRFQRRGYALEAARRALEFGFGTLGLAEIVAFTIPANEPSWRLMERLGMERAGSFDHPRVAEGHPMRRHLLYRLRRRETA